MVSICIIAKNEEKNIEKCLSSFEGCEAELVVVDTGSTDRTVELARKYTDAIYDFEWCNDFAAAKNFAISKASNEVVVVIDSDEYLIWENQDAFRFELLRNIERNARNNPKQVGRIRRRNIFHRDGEVRENEEWINRVFLKSNFAYSGKIHEQVVMRVDNCKDKKSDIEIANSQSKSNSNYETYYTDLLIGHSGYDLSEEEIKAKTKRNIDLLMSEFKETQKDDENYPYLIYQLGKSYYMAGDYEKAVEYFDEGLYFDLDPKLEYVIDMVETYGYALLNSGHADVAYGLKSVENEFGNSADFQLLLGLIEMNNEHFDEAISCFEKATSFEWAKAKGANSFLSYYNAGVICECLGDIPKAIQYYKKCGDYEKATARLKLL